MTFIENLIGLIGNIYYSQVIIWSIPIIPKFAVEGELIQ